jgi:hypothetical protein
VPRELLPAAVLCGSKDEEENAMDAISRPQDQRTRVSIEASDFSCEGTVHLSGIRLSDVMNEKYPFLAVIDAVVVHRLPGTAEKRLLKYETILIRKGEIKYVVPIDTLVAEPKSPSGLLAVQSPD